MFSSEFVFATGTVFLVAFITSSEEHSTGAPLEACDDMKPQHKVEPANSLSTFYVATNALTVKPGVPITVHIRSISKEHTFKGFLVQARDTEFNIIGSFLPSDDSKLISCGNGVNNAATHVNAEEKKKIQLTWLPPNGTINGPIRFQLSLVKDYNKFWVGIKSEELIVVH